MDQREAILERLVAIAEGLGDFAEVFRNVTEFPDQDTIPACAILEGDELSDEDDPIIRGSRAPRIIRMIPQMVIYAGSQVETVGPTLNDLRSKLIDAVLTDDDLITLTFNRQGPRYLGLESDLAFGREMLGRMALRFSIPYRLLPA